MGNAAHSNVNAQLPLANVRVVLSHTTHPGNIGAAARAMKTMGITRLHLVNPLHFPDPQADAMASGAIDVVQSANVCASLEEALAGTIFAVGLTARRRDLSHEMLWLQDAAPKIVQEARRGAVALVFGTEMSGLSNAELDRCQLLAGIPADPGFSSLNLAAAVQVVAYEMRRAALVAPALHLPDVVPADFDEIEKFYLHLEQTLHATGFLDPAEPKRLMRRLRRLFARARLEKEEVNILRGILKAVERAVEQSR
jgi:tRNA/rRNA methyltransferase